MCRSSNDLDAESLLDIAFFKALNSFKEEHGVKFVSYLGKIFKRDCIEYKSRFKTKNRADFICVDTHSKEEEGSPDILSGYNKRGKITTLVNNSSQREDLLEAIGRLPQKEAEIMRLYLDGHTNGEIALQLDMCKSVVSRLMSRSISSLREVFLGQLI